jgi:hypothetical protein
MLLSCSSVCVVEFNTVKFLCFSLGFRRIAYIRVEELPPNSFPKSRTGFFFLGMRSTLNYNHNWGMNLEGPELGFKSCIRYLSRSQAHEEIGITLRVLACLMLLRGARDYRRSLLKVYIQQRGHYVRVCSESHGSSEGEESK